MAPYARCTFKQACPLNKLASDVPLNKLVPQTRYLLEQACLFNKIAAETIWPLKPACPLERNPLKQNGSLKKTCPLNNKAP